ncbi:MAG: RloB domain-containing protein [Desulfatibacillum sp.]|nr:RloB domain-containing protein [Desulfatibacillum sp.]
MERPRRRYIRKPGTRRYRKLFIIAAEGLKTEPQYFAIFNNQERSIQVKCLTDKKGASPPQVLDRMKRFLRDNGLLKSDEAWLVTDKDQWTDEQLAQLHAWSLKSPNYGFCLSNPKFEFWLLLHFEDGAGVSSSDSCDKRLNVHIPDYNKGIDARKISETMIRDAIARAKARDIPPCTDWPRNLGSTVYRLVESILNT